MSVKLVWVTENKEISGNEKQMIILEENQLKIFFGLKAISDKRKSKSERKNMIKVLATCTRNDIWKVISRNCLTITMAFFTVKEHLHNIGSSIEAFTTYYM